MRAGIALFCFVGFSVLNRNHVWQTKSHYLCLWFFLHAWSIMFVPKMIVLNLSKHSCLAAQSSACTTKRHNHCILTLIMPVSAPLSEGFRAKKNSIIKHLLVSLNHYLNVHTKRVPDKDSTSCCHSSARTQNNRCADYLSHVFIKITKAIK